jgi:hypothetical protein
LFQSVYNDYLHGNLEVARARASQARKNFSTGSVGEDPAWESRFRLLEAEILLRQFRARDTLQLLGGGTGPPALGELASKRSLLLALAHLHVGQSRE